LKLCRSKKANNFYLTMFKTSPANKTAARQRCEKAHLTSIYNKSRQFILEMKDVGYQR
jgi:hypothetical protein